MQVAAQIVFAVTRSVANRNPTIMKITYARNSVPDDVAAISRDAEGKIDRRICRMITGTASKMAIRVCQGVWLMATTAETSMITNAVTIAKSCNADAVGGPNSWTSGADTSIVTRAASRMK